MTLSTTTAVKQYDGDGSTVSFPTVFKFLANADVQITHRDSSDTETVWVEGTQYTLAGALSETGGTVTVNTSPTDYTPATGETITIERITTETQGTDYPAGGKFPSSAHETALDRLTMLVQQLSAQLARTLKFPVTDADTLSAEIPNSTDRASGRLGFDSSGEPIIVTSDITGVAATAFGTTLVEAVSAAAARLVLGLLAVSTDNALARYNGTGGILQDSGWTLDDSDVLLGGDNILQRPVLKDYGETINAIGATGGGTQDIDITLGNVVTATVDTSTNTFTFSNPSASGTGCSFTLKLTNGGSQTVNWPASVDWPSATAPTLTTSGVDILVFYTDDGGTIWHGKLASQDSS